MKKPELWQVAVVGLLLVAGVLWWTIQEQRAQNPTSGAGRELSDEHREEERSRKCWRERVHPTPEYFTKRAASWSEDGTMLVVSDVLARRWLAYPSENLSQGRALEAVGTCQPE